MKRSKGVTIIAALLIMSGVADLVRMVSEFRSFGDENVSKRELRFDRMLARRNLSPAEEEEGRQAFHRLMIQYKSQHVQSEERAEWVAGAALNLVALMAGIGLLRMEPWGRVLTQLYAGLCILVTLWAMLAFSSRQPQAVEIARLMPKFVGQDETNTENVQAFVGRLAMVTYLVGIFWDSFVIWFFQRPKIKKQFQAARNQS